MDKYSLRVVATFVCTMQRSFLPIKYDNIILYIYRISNKKMAREFSRHKNILFLEIATLVASVVVLVLLVLILVVLVLILLVLVLIVLLVLVLIVLVLVVVLVVHARLYRMFGSLSKIFVKCRFLWQCTEN